MAFVVIDNFGDKSEKYETKKEAEQFVRDAYEMELEDDGFVRRRYNIIEVK